jgi:CDP-diacylglycerol--glycerol-3-phosphate 3-phosphatidyltransferase
MATSFGPSALATPANALTIARLASTPLLLAVVLGAGSDGSWLAVSVWFVLSCTDGVDGWLARRHGTTASGAFLDPLADKVVVLGAMAALVVNDVFWWLPVLLIAGREVAISAYRSWMGRRGVSVPARPLAKAKTLVQDLAVGFALLPMTAETHPGVAGSFLWLAVALTLVSGTHYLVDGAKLAGVPHEV